MRLVNQIRGSALVLPLIKQSSGKQIQYQVVNFFTSTDGKQIHQQNHDNWQTIWLAAWLTNSSASGKEIR